MENSKWVYFPFLIENYHNLLRSKLLTLSWKLRGYFFLFGWQKLYSMLNYQYLLECSMIECMIFLYDSKIFVNIDKIINK